MSARDGVPLRAPLRQVVVRPARREDVDQIAAIERRAFSDPWSASSFRGLFGNSHVYFAVAEDAPGGRLVGYIVAWLVADEAEIANLAVADEARRGGVGALLLDSALELAAGRGARAAFLEVRESNEAARALYASRHFQIVGRRTRYYRKPAEDALVLRRGL